jgi:hypothetical protein
MDYDKALSALEYVINKFDEVYSSSRKEEKDEEE